MKSRFTFGLLLIIILSFILLVACTKANTKENLREGTQGEEYILKIGIFPSGSYSETYWIEMDESGKMYCQFGERKRNEDFDSEDFLKDVTLQEEKQLNETELAEVIASADDVRHNYETFEDKGYLDNWDVIVSYEGEIYEGVCWDIEPGALQKFVQVIIKVSPIAIDLHGWS